MAEAWLIAQEPYVTSRDVGDTVDEVEKLIKRHEAFEKSTATWEERFSALERLTTVQKKKILKVVYSNLITGLNTVVLLETDEVGKTTFNNKYINKG